MLKWLNLCENHFHLLGIIHGRSERPENGHPNNILTLA